MKKANTKPSLFLYGFLGFCTALFLFAGFISIPTEPVSIHKTGRPTTGTHEWYILDKECYTIVQQLDTIYHSSSISTWFGKHYTYFLVEAEDASGFSYDMIVRACGKEKDLLTQYESVTLYGMVSGYQLGDEADAIVLPCLNDNGDTVLSRWVKAFTFLVCGVIVVLLTIYTARRNRSTTTIELPS